MTLTLQEISDRIEITDTITRYSYGLDQRIWPEWDRTFTPDAVLDFSAVGMSEHSPAELRAIFTQGDATRIPVGQHLLHNTVIEVDGDRATARSEYTMTTHSRTETEGKARRVQGGGWYSDELVRTDAGWRITRRTANSKWIDVVEVDWAAPVSD
ncbi:nuclear transport factor 2 family protein [Occultella gossypii]|uniref:Nuclear transport factor 2 family protein n=1 Tax=Occultella gossypii TaxID=2800820 RepID=A0ABS7S4Y8_9MICO|nr:nuclear transport factor 2 family protein [Occultella gossypii]MBZ2195409.1 nuclear transport factor 2 family protein [Occultella gossypii]